jgi:hypothetical protein
LRYSPINYLTMKRLFFIVLVALIAYPSLAQIEMNSSGNVGIGGGLPSSTYDLSTYKFQATGDALFSSYLSSILIESFATSPYGYPAKRIVPTSNNISTIGYYGKAFNVMFSYSFATLSDQRQKENIKQLTGSLDIIKSLSGVKYDLKKSVFETDSVPKDSKYSDHVEKIRKNKIGFIAQDVNKFLPEAVLHDDSTDIYAVDYTKIVPVLVEAIKEQQVQIEELQNLISKQKPSGNRLDGVDGGNVINTSSLMQNNPNPFTESTQIRYTLPDEAMEALLFIYNLNGQQLKKITLDQSGDGSLTIPGREFKAGLYHYTLVVDGKLIDTKKMILTD